MASGEITVTVQTLDRWRAMAYAPLDGTKVLLLVRHRTWWTAQKCSPEDAGIWEAECEGQWLDHNGGGWSWAGMSGTPIGWRPLNLCERVMREGLGDQCVWLRPAAAEFECLGEPSLCTNPRGCACVPDSKTPNAEVSGRAGAAGEGRA